jgi:glycosyltransferase involved in cell wall biosynthesis
MNVSVVIPTLNNRDQLAACLDALSERAPGVETIVVNGPSTDGTSGMVRERDDVAVLVELDERNINVARNAGLGRSRGDVIAFLEDAFAVEDGWLAALRSGVETAAEEVVGVTGPVHRPLRAGMTTESFESSEIGGREVTYFNGGNVAFRRKALDELDGFDEYLMTGGARDAAHRLATLGSRLTWLPEFSASHVGEVEGADARRALRPDGGETKRDWHWRYRSLAYRLVKTYGVRPLVIGRLARHAGHDAVKALRDVAAGEINFSAWFGNGRDVLTGMGRGVLAGQRARLRDRTSRRNPNGWSSRTDRAVAVFDRR